MTTVIRNITGGKEQMRRYFDFVKRRIAFLRQKNGCSGEELVLLLAGRRLAVVLDSTHFYRQTAPSFACLRTEKILGETETLFIWRDKVDRYCPPLPHDAYDDEIWKHSSEWAELFIPLSKKNMEARHIAEKEWYLCLAPEYSLDPAYVAHPLRPQLHLWARAHNLMLLHGAAVEINGCGIFLAAAGGRGKSTLAVSSLLAGHHYAGDDYVLVDETPAAYPLYSSAYLNRDSLEKMPYLQGEILYHDAARDKTLIDLSAYKNRIKSRVKLHLVLSPEVSASGKASLTRITPSRPLWQTIRTSAAQNGAMHDRVFRTTIFNTLSKLPAYRFCLSPDLDANIRLLENFVKEKSEALCIP